MKKSHSLKIVISSFIFLLLIGFGISLQKNVSSTNKKNAGIDKVLAATNAASTQIDMKLFLHGLGKAGDSAKPGSNGNLNPTRKIRTVQVSVYNTQNQPVVTKTGQVTFRPTIGDYRGTIDLGAGIPTGAYTIKVKTDQYLRALIPGIQTLTEGTTNQLPETTVITGDINNDNSVNIQDYTILLGCYSDLFPAKNCPTGNSELSDITDDGQVNALDYNLFLRELTNISGEPAGTVAPMPTATQTPTPTVTKTPTPTPATTGRTYPLHTNIVATTFWVGEIFNANLSDGSQVCSTYDSDWAYHWSGVNNGTVPANASGCAGAIVGGCDGVPGSNNACSTEARTATNGYFPTKVTPKENPFYLDLPFDDINDTTAYAQRCQVIPWANDPGYSGKCTDRNFSYMKNRWVKITGPNGNTCYGQIEDAGPSHGNLYHDAAYVFGTNNTQPIQGQFNNAGMDVSPALNGCLGFSELDGESDKVSWQFVDNGDVPAGPWKTIITTLQVN